jgi:hypothetical protein
MSAAPEGDVGPSVPGRYDETRARADGHNRRVMLAALKEAGATRVIAEYSGSGDDGSFHRIAIEGVADDDREVEGVALTWAGAAGGGVYALVPQRMSLRALVEDAVGAYVDEAHAGWENGCGAAGTLTLDVATGTVALTHHEYYEATETVESTGRFA